MAPFVAGLLRAAAEAFPLPAPAVQIGSYRADLHSPDFRPLFLGRPFVGIDERPGRGVDLVATAEALPLGDASVGCFVALNALGHVRRFWTAFEEIKRVLRPDGVAVLCAPFHAALDPKPSDYWRFAPDAFELLLEDYPQRLAGWHGSARRPLHVWAIAFGRETAPVSAAQLARFRRCLDLHAQEPLPLSSRVLRLFGGRDDAEGGFARSRWQMEFHGPDSASALAA